MILLTLNQFLCDSQKSLTDRGSRLDVCKADQIIYLNGFFCHGGLTEMLEIFNHDAVEPSSHRSLVHFWECSVACLKPQKLQKSSRNT